MSLHALLQTMDLIQCAGQGAADVHYVQDLQRTLGQIHKVLVVAAQRRSAHVVAANVEYHAVPIQNEGRLHLGGE